MAVAHAALMIAAWALLIPTGILVARHRFVGDAWWFQLHRGLQLLGLLCTFAGLACIVDSVNKRGVSHFSSTHGRLGLAVVAIAVLQPINAVLRPAATTPGFKPTQRRSTWEVVHRVIGYGCVILAWLNVLFGLQLPYTAADFGDASRMLEVAFYVSMGLMLGSGIFGEIYRIYQVRTEPDTETVYEGF